MYIHVYIYIYLEPQTTIKKWMFGETTISYVKIGNPPIETTIYKWLFGVPGIYILYCFFLQQLHHPSPPFPPSHLKAGSLKVWSLRHTIISVNPIVTCELFWPRYIYIYTIYKHAYIYIYICCIYCLLYMYMYIYAHVYII